MLDINEISPTKAIQSMPANIDSKTRAKVNESIERVLSFTESLKSEKVKKQFQSRPEDGVRAAEELGFSESSMDDIRAVCKGTVNKSLKAAGYSEDTPLQFAGFDNSAEYVGNFTTGTLNMVIQEVGSNIDKDSVLSLEFPDKPVPTYQVIIDRMKGTSGILPEADGDSSPIPTVRPLDSYGAMYKSGLWGARCPVGAKDLFFARKRGGVGFDERAVTQIVAYNSINLMTQSFARKKQMLSDAIFKNGFEYAGATINSNIPVQNFIPLQSMGNLNPDGSVSYDTSDPYYSPLISITNVVNNPLFYKFRQYIIGIVVAAADLQAIMNHPQVRAVSNILMAASTSLGKKTLNVQIGDLSRDFLAFYAPGFDIPILADADQWQSQNADGTPGTTSNLIIPRGYMKVLLDLAPIGGQSGAFHLTLNEFDPNVETPAMGYFQGVFPKNLMNSDNTNRLDIVGSLAGAPAIYMPEAQFIFTGLYSNVTSPGVID